MVLTEQAADELTVSVEQPLPSNGQDKEQKQINMVLYGSLLPLALTFVFLFFVVYRNRREKAFRKREFQLELSRSDMEMKALRSQVNPHFIFNCLASIQNFVAKNDNKQAEFYLVRFGSLIRQVLENSTERMVSIDDDLEALRKYVEMEQMRLKNAFEFKLLIAPEVDVHEMFIPPLIIQPLVENAIWHGTGNSEAQKSTIEVELRKKDEETLVCFTRNPIFDISKPKRLNPNKKKSLGLSLITERLNLLSELHNHTYTVDIRNVEQLGEDGLIKEVEITIPCVIE